MYPESILKLIEAFRKLPGVGEKTAERYALQVSEMDERSVQEFTEALTQVKTVLTHCEVCGNLSDTPVCDICSDNSRKKDVIFVVQSPKDVIAMERTGQYQGQYHVLNGLISSTKGILPEDLNISTLVDRAKNAKEVILATNATIDGETTAMYLDKLLKKECPNLLITRIAHGLPAGGLLDYADEVTLAHALQGRKEMGK